MLVPDCRHGVFIMDFVIVRLWPKMNRLRISFKNCIRRLTDESDTAESKIESLGNADQVKKRGKKDEPKKADKEVCLRCSALSEMKTVDKGKFKKRKFVSVLAKSKED